MDILIGELVTWKQFTGDRRLNDALAERDEREDALPLAPKELARLFPALWPKKKADERRAAKNAPEAHRELNTFRPPRQTGWEAMLAFCSPP
jgi:hypothetical protein